MEKFNNNILIPNLSPKFTLSYASSKFCDIIQIIFEYEVLTNYTWEKQRVLKPMVGEQPLLLADVVLVVAKSVRSPHFLSIIIILIPIIASRNFLLFNLKYFSI